MLSESALRLLREAIKTVWALQLLLLLRKEAARPLTVERLARELRATPTLVGDILAKFKDQGLIAELQGAVQYRPERPELDQAVAEIEGTYATTPIALIKLIAEAPNDKIRAFADAFKLKRE